VDGEYYLSLALVYQDSLLQGNVTEGILSRSRAMCSKLSGNALQDCMRYYVEIGKRSYELLQIPKYGQCRHYVQMALNGINDDRSNNTINEFAALLEYSVQATALKWCQARFGQNLTVVPPNASLAPGDSLTPEDLAPESTQPHVFLPSRNMLALGAGAVVAVLALVVGIIIARRR
jgi:hypothetical protein